MDREVVGTGPIVVGVFDDTYRAEAAIGELGQIGIPEDRVEYTMSEEASVAGSYTAGEDPRFYGRESSQAIVTVRAGDRRQEVIDLLQRYGAYNVRSTDAGGAQKATGGTPRDVGSSGASSVSEGATGSAYDARRDAEGRGAGDLPEQRTEEGGRWEDMTSYYRSRWQQQYGTAGRRWEDYEPAYRYGWESARMGEHHGKSWTEAEPELRSKWESQHHEKPWDRVVDAVRDAWEQITGSAGRDADRAA